MGVTNWACIYPNCPDNNFARGLCRHHYGIAKWQIQQKKLTWEKLVKQGKARPIIRESGRNYVDRRRFMTEEEKAWFGIV